MAWCLTTFHILKNKKTRFSYFWVSIFQACDDVPFLKMPYICKQFSYECCIVWFAFLSQTQTRNNWEMWEVAKRNPQVENEQRRKRKNSSHWSECGKETLLSNKPLLDIYLISSSLHLIGVNTTNHDIYQLQENKVTLLLKLFVHPIYFIVKTVT